MTDNFKQTTGSDTIENDLNVGDDVTVGDKITADHIDLQSGAIITGLGTGANGIKLKNLKNAAAGTLTGTALNVEIDIGWTPYYFAVYPTKS